MGFLGVLLPVWIGVGILALNQKMDQERETRLVAGIIDLLAAGGGVAYLRKFLPWYRVQYEIREHPDYLPAVMMVAIVAVLGVRMVWCAYCDKPGWPKPWNERARTRGTRSRLLGTPRRFGDVGYRWSNTETSRRLRLMRQCFCRWVICPIRGHQWNPVHSRAGWLICWTCDRGCGAVRRDCVLLGHQWKLVDDGRKWICGRCGQDKQENGGSHGR